MEGLTHHSAELKNLRGQAIRLASDIISLTHLFAEEEIRLNRNDEASRLITLQSSISQRLDWVKNQEDSARYANSEVRGIISLGALAIKVISEDKRLQSFSDRLIKKPSDKQTPFGNVLVYIGPKGIPDDAGVVSISLLSRESKREESQVINEIKRRGYLLLTEKDFSLLIERLVKDVLEGQLSLPICAEKLFEAKTSERSKIEVKEYKISAKVPVPDNS